MIGECSECGMVRTLCYLDEQGGRREVGMCDLCREKQISRANRIESFDVFVVAQTREHR